MKKFLIIVLVILLAISGGVLAYGIMQGTPEGFVKESEGLLAAPGEDVKTGAAHWYDPEEVTDGLTLNEKAAYLLVYTAYNHINCKQFYFEAHMDMTAGDAQVVSDYFRAEQGTDFFYNACAFTGAGANATRRVEYVDQRMDVKGLAGTKIVLATYDKSNKQFSYKMDKATVKNDQEFELPDEVPYILYSWYDLPIDLGGLRQANSKDATGRSEEIDASLIKNARITDPTEEKPYYTLTFETDRTKLNASDESLDRLAGSLSDQIDRDKEIDVQQMSFTVEIWPEGLFRSISIDCRMTATVKGDKGNAHMEKDYKFSYADKDCCVAYYLRYAPGNWETFLSDDNKEAVEEAIQALDLDDEDEEE